MRHSIPVSLNVPQEQRYMIPQILERTFAQQNRYIRSMSYDEERNLLLLSRPLNAEEMECFEAAQLEIINER